MFANVAIYVQSLITHIANSFIFQHIPHAGDVVMCDTTGSLDRVNSKLFRMVCPSPAGALPLASIILSTESRIMLTKGYSMLKNILPESAFFHRGPLGPRVIVTDDCEPEFQSLLDVWPSATHVLCVWHVLEAVHRWLLSARNNVNNEEDRKYLFKQFQKLLFCKTVEEYSECLETFLEDPILEKYDQFLTHLENLYLNRPEKWALYARATLSDHGNVTNNYVESHFRIMKECVFHRHKSFNLPDLLDVLMKDESEYYRRMCIDVANGRFNSRQSKYKIPENLSISKDQVTQISEFVFMVESEKDSNVQYSVDMKSGICACKKGANKAPCKHKFAISKHYGVSQFFCLPENDIEAKKIYCTIAMGYSQPTSWYRGITDTGDCDDNENENENEHTTDQADENENTVSGDVSSENRVDDDLNLNLDFNNMSIDEVEADHAVIDDEDEDNISEDIEDFRGTIETFIQNVKNNKNNKTYRTAFKRFKDSLKSNVSNEKSMVNLMFSFAHEGSQRKTQKKKNSHKMKVQQRSIQRRKYKNRGTGQATSGRRYANKTHRNSRTGRKFKEAAKRTLLNIAAVDMPDKSDFFYSGPSSSQQSRANPRSKHSLRNAVEGNYNNAKNHSRSMN